MGCNSSSDTADSRARPAVTAQHPHAAPQYRTGPPAAAPPPPVTTSAAPYYPGYPAYAAPPPPRGPPASPPAAGWGASHPASSPPPPPPAPAPAPAPTPSPPARQAPQGGNADVCACYLTGFCAAGSSCPYLHDPAAAAAVRTQGGPTAAPCRYFMAGHCREGASCQYSHTTVAAPGTAVSPPPVAVAARSSSTDQDSYRRVIEASRREEEDRQLRTAMEHSRSQDSMGRTGSSEAPPPPPPPAYAPSAAKVAANEEENGKPNPYEIFMTFPYTPPQRGTREVESFCAICFENYTAGASMLILPCMHRFHAKCIADWIEKKPKCPTCEVDVYDTGSKLFLDDGRQRSSMVLSE